MLVIASQDHLESLEDAYKRRINNIITIDQIKQKYISDYNNGVNDDNNEVGDYENPATPQEPVVSDAENPQRKGKERKLKERGNGQTDDGNSKLDKKQEKAPSFSKINIDYQEEINNLCNHLETENIFPDVVHFVNEMIFERNINPKAIIHALKKAKIKKKFDDTRGGANAYCMKIIIVEDGNYNEAEHIENHEKLRGQEEIHPDLKKTISDMNGA